MTEGEAKKTWCPESRSFALRDGGVSTNMLAGGNTCIGSRCAAWRWIPLSTSEPGYLEACRRASQRKGEDGKPLGQKWAALYVGNNRAEFGLKKKPDEGYCGRAGRP